MKTIYFALLIVGFLFLSQPAMAYTLPSLNDPVPVISGVAINPATVQNGADFQASLSEPIFYKNLQLPEGTQFIGHIYNANQYSHWGSPEHFEVWISQAVFPDGTRFAIYPNEQIHPNYAYTPAYLERYHGNFIEAGGRLKLRFSPDEMKGMLQTGTNN